ncbi:MAG: ATP synthase F0 subunit B [Thermodesulfobacteriota bacterium]|nr:ATP synthase F0 subunit B [Thermodesulfobacteriota bacterium]
MNRKTNWSKVGIVALTVLCLFAMVGMLYASSGADAGHGSPDAAVEHAAGGHGDVAHGDDAHGGHGEHHSSLTSAKLKDLLWRCTNFAGLVIILVVFASKPIAAGLNARREGIAARKDDLEAEKVKAQKMYSEYESKLSKIDVEVKSIIESAVAQGEKEREQIVADAERMAVDIKRKAESAIHNATIEARRSLRIEMADKAVEIAEELVKKSLKAKDQNRLIENCLAKVGG